MLNWRFDLPILVRSLFTSTTIFVSCIHLACVGLLYADEATMPCPYARVERLSSLLQLAFGNCACLTSEKE